MLRPLCVWKGFTAVSAAEATLKPRSNQHLEHKATSTRAQQQRLSSWLGSQITEQLLTFRVHLAAPTPSPFPLSRVVTCNRQSIYCTSCISPCHNICLIASQQQFSLFGQGISRVISEPVTVFPDGPVTQKAKGLGIQEIHMRGHPTESRSGQTRRPNTSKTEGAQTRAMNQTENRRGRGSKCVCVCVCVCVGVGVDVQYVCRGGLSGNTQRDSV